MAMLQLTGTGMTVKAGVLFGGPHAAPFTAARIPVSRRQLPQGVTVKAAAVVAPKYTTVRPLGDRVLIKTKSSEDTTAGGILLPSTAQSKPQGGEVVAVGDGRKIGDTKVEIGVKVAEAEEKTAGGLLLTHATKEKPSVGTVVGVGPGALDEKGNRIPLTVGAGSTVLYSKYAGNEFKSADGTDYIVLRASDVMAILS